MMSELRSALFDMLVRGRKMEPHVPSGQTALELHTAANSACLGKFW